ncbi:MAG: heavy-metal-associated domain-containing protein [Planctomycetes bacterium]|nr:heavy-metal-associated domain-containing protein [Planctomycetota bacterium]
MKTVDLAIEGMSCNHCVGRVKKTLERVPAVRVDDVQVGSARVTLEPGAEPLAQVLVALADAGFPARTLATG